MFKINRQLVSLMALMTILIGLPSVANAQEGVTTTWTWDGTDNNTTGVASVEGVNSVSTLSYGADLTLVSPQAVAGKSLNRLQPGTSNVGDDREEDALTLMVTPKNGLTMTVTHLHFLSARYGTNGGKIDVVAQSGDNSVTLASDIVPNRNNNADGASVFDFDISGITATYNAPLYVHIYIKELGNTKQIGFRDITVTGNYEGTVIALPSYTFNAQIAEPEAGAVSVKPAGTVFDEGTMVTVTAAENFGYHFTSWTDADGKVVSTENPYTFSIAANTNLTANYSHNKVYALNMTLTEGARKNLVTIVPEGNVVDGVHNYEEGTVVKLTALNNKILTFTGWEDNTTDAERVITMDGDKDVTANFAAADYIVGWDLYDDDPKSERAADYKSDTENAGLLSLHNEAGQTSSWLSRGHNNGQENGKYAARIWSKLTNKMFFEISFSTKGYKNITVSNDLGNDYNSYTTYFEQVSTDGQNYETVGTFTLPNRGWAGNQDIRLSEKYNDQERVYVRWMPDFTSPMVAVASDNDGLSIGEIFVLGESDAADDAVAPKLVSSNPANGSMGASANGSIVLTFDEKITSGAGNATLNGETLQAIITGKTAVYKYAGLSYATNYTFSLPAGAITDRNGNAFEGTEITFTTMQRTQPSAKLYDAVVAQDGTGDYLTLQEAIAAAPAGGAVPYLIFVKKGRYDGHITIPANKPNIHIIGQGKQYVTVADNRKSGGENAYGIEEGATMNVESNDVYLEGFDLINSYGVESNSGPQALALCSKGDRFILNKMGLRSYQDTWFTGKNDNNRAYAVNSWIEGAVDFFYGKGNVMITNDTINIVRKNGGYIVAPNHGVGTRWGYVFLNNVVTAPGVPSETSVWLGRPWHEAPMTLFINTKFEVTIPATGWYPTMGGLPKLWAEYNSMDKDGNPLDLSQRIVDYFYMNGDQKVTGKSDKAVLTAEEAAQYTTKNVCGGTDAWDPELVCEPCAAPELKANDGTISWDAVPYAICYVVTKGDDVVAFTKDLSYAAKDNGEYKVQAVNENGGLSNYATLNVTTGIDGVTSGAATKMIKDVFTFDGHKTAGLHRGINIVRYTDGTTAKIVVK